MSRSYKKHPCWGDDSCNGIHSRVHYFKNYSNKMVRKPWHWDLPSGNAYKRVFETWNIRDYQSVMYTKQQVMDALEEAKRDYDGTYDDHRAWRRNWENDQRNNFYRKYTLRYYYYAK